MARVPCEMADEQLQKALHEEAQAKEEKWLQVAGTPERVSLWENVGFPKTFTREHTRRFTADLGWVDLGRPGSKREWGETSRNVASRLW